MYILNLLFGKKMNSKGVELVPNFNLYCAGKSRKQIAIRGNKLCKSRERITIRQNKLYDSRERITNPRDRVAQFVITRYFCSFGNQHVPSEIL